eukprot:gene3310-13337_t
MDEWVLVAGIPCASRVYTLILGDGPLPQTEFQCTDGASPPPAFYEPLQSYQLYVEVPLKRIQITESSARMFLCPSFKAAIDQDLSSRGVDSNVAYILSSLTHDDPYCIISSTSSRIFYKAWLTLTPSVWSTLMEKDKGLASAAFVNRAQIPCWSTLVFADRYGKVMSMVSEGKLPALSVSTSPTLCIEWVGA